MFIRRIGGVRVRLHVSTSKKTIRFEFDERDVAVVSSVALMTLSSAVDGWAREWLAKNPGWKVS